MKLLCSIAAGLVVLLCSIGCSSLSDEAWQLSVETNTALMQKYEAVSYEFMGLLEDLITQLEANGKDTGGLSEWVSDLKKHNADVVKIVSAYKKMIKSGVMESTPWLVESLKIADSLITIKDKYDG